MPPSCHMQNPFGMISCQSCQAIESLLPQQLVAEMLDTKISLDIKEILNLGGILTVFLIAEMLAFVPALYENLEANKNEQKQTDETKPNPILNQHSQQSLLLKL